MSYSVSRINEVCWLNLKFYQMVMYWGRKGAKTSFKIETFTIISEKTKDNVMSSFDFKNTEIHETKWWIER
jgi:hypothetical protein